MGMLHGGSIRPGVAIIDELGFAVFHHARMRRQLLILIVVPVRVQIELRLLLEAEAAQSQVIAGSGPLLQPLDLFTLCLAETCCAFLADI